MKETAAKPRGRSPARELVLMDGVHSNSDKLVAGSRWAITAAVMRRGRGQAAGMQDETIALFERCETARAAAKAKALAEGKSERDAYTVAHEAAKVVWNGWAAQVETAGGRVANVDFGGVYFAMEDPAPRGINVNGRALHVVPATTIDFSGFVFPGRVCWHGTHFSGDAWFEKAQFSSEAEFKKAQFSGNVRFSDVSFSGDVSFELARFSGSVVFNSARFSRSASFDSAIFSGDAGFEYARFSATARFVRAQFVGKAQFAEAEFTGDTRFVAAQFIGTASFESARFADEIRFWRAKFLGNAFFSRAMFCHAEFSTAEFSQYSTFAQARFYGPANFNAIRGERAFELADATFEVVPDFIQAHFEEAPRLDNVEVVGRMVEPPASRETAEDAPLPENLSRPRMVAWRCGRASREGWRYCKYGYPRRWVSGARERVLRADRDSPARWRALKRLAVQAHDQDREHEFFAREIRAARFVTDWPLPWPVWKAQGWAAFARFWFGFLYGLFADHGRSVVLPVFWWMLIVSTATAFYLGEHPGVASDRALLREQGYGWASSWIGSTYTAAWASPERCHEPANPPPDRSVQPIAPQNTSAPDEAFQLALRTGLIAFDPGPESALRTYRCLYGLEQVGGRPMPAISWAVSNMIIGQKLFSAVMIFLFGLALRNMLKMK